MGLNKLTAKRCDVRSFEYKYIVVSYGYDYYDYVYHQFKDSDYAIYSHQITFPFFVESLFYRHIFSDRLPFKKFWTKLYVWYLSRYVKSVASSEDKICFLLLAGGKNNILLKYGLVEKLRKKYRESKIVFFINDLISKTKQPISLMKDKADLVISFDRGDADKYKLLNYVIPYSDFKFETSEIEYDVTFVGAAKDRLHELLGIHKYLMSQGINSHFHIINPPEKERFDMAGVVYSGFIPYEENLKILSRSRCIIEIVQKGGTGNTIRVGEAIIMGKKLLTNNQFIRTNGVYDSSNMSVFTSCQDIDLEFIKDKREVRYSSKEQIYPVNLLHFIESKLQ